MVLQRHHYFPCTGQLTPWDISVLINACIQCSVYIVVYLTLNYYLHEFKLDIFKGVGSVYVGVYILFSPQPNFSSSDSIVTK